MRKLIVAACIAAAAVLSASPATANETRLPAGTKDCPPGYVGYVVWAVRESYEVVWFCIPFGP
jgi:hypothetical protein